MGEKPTAADDATSERVMEKTPPFQTREGVPIKGEEAEGFVKMNTADARYKFGSADAPGEAIKLGPSEGQAGIAVKQKDVSSRIDPSAGGGPAVQTPGVPGLDASSKDAAK